MAQALTPGQRVQVRAWCTFGDQASVNAYNMVIQSVTGGGAITDLQLAQSMDSAFHSLYPPMLVPDASYDGVQVQILAPPQLYIAQQSVTGANAGTAAPGALPKQTAGLISIHTTLAGRQYRGRLYMPFPASVFDTGDGEVTPAYQTLLANITGFLAATTSLTVGGTTVFWTWSLFHRKSKSGVIPVPTPIDYWTVSNRWATQRRRGAYGRQNRSPLA